MNLSWSIGPGMRIGIVGVNGAGKTTLLRLLDGEITPDSGRVKRGKTLRIGYLSQDVAELRGHVNGSWNRSIGSDVRRSWPLVAR
jgi:ATPase subunit of ABC transporter with duplicated ATPase domains